MNDQTLDVQLWMNMYGKMTENIVGDWLRNITILQMLRNDFKIFVKNLLILYYIEKKFH